MKLFLFALLASFCQEIPVGYFDSIKSSGSASVKKVSADEVELETLGSGSISINGKCNKVEAATRGSGVISL